MIIDTDQRSGGSLTGAVDTQHGRGTLCRTIIDSADMNAMHLHLILNHVPVLGTIVGLALLVLALFRSSDELKRVALSFLIVTALVGVPVYLTGEPAEDGVSGLPGVSKQIIETHEDAAQVAFVALSVLGVIALAFLIGSRRKATVPRWMGVTVLAGSLVVSGLMGWTANLGGKIRHTEIQGGTAAQSGGEGQHED